MIKHNTRTVQNFLTALHPQRRTFLMNHVFKIGIPDELNISEIMLLAMADWLSGGKLVTEDTQQVILLEFKDAFIGFAKAFEPIYESGDPLPVVTFGVLDRRFASMPGPGFYNLQEGTWISELPYPAVTLVHCDLSTLLVRLLKNVEGAYEQQHSAAEPGSTAQAG